MQTVFQNIECRCRLRVEQPVLEVFCFEDNDAMTQFQFPTAELTFWWPEISWKPSSLAVTWGGGALRKKTNSFLIAVYKRSSFVLSFTNLCIESESARILSKI